MADASEQILQSIRDEAVERQKKRERTELKTEKKENDRINALMKLRKGANSQDRKAYIAEIQEIKEARKAREEERTFRETRLGQIKSKEEELAILREKIERDGGIAEKNTDFLKMQKDIAKETFNLQLEQASPGKKKELLKEQLQRDAKQLTVLQRISANIFSLGDYLKEKGKAAKVGFIDFLKKTALIGLLLLLPKILNSQFAKDTVKFLEEKVPAAFKFVREGFGNIADFFTDPSLENFFNLFNAETGVAAGIALLTPLLLPFGIGKILRSGLGLAIKGFVKGIKGMGAGLALLGSDTFVDEQGRTRDKKTKRFAKKPSYGKSLAKGALKAIPGVGLIATAAFGIFDGVRAGLEEAKNESATKMSIARESIAGVLSGLTFGFISQESISQNMQDIGDAVSKGYEATKKGFNDMVDYVKDIELPTMEDVTTGIDKAGDSIKAGYDKMTEQFDVFAGKVGEVKDSLVANFEKITGIELPTMDEITTKLEEFGTNLKSRALSFIGDAKEKLVNIGKGAKEFVTGLFKKDDDTQEKIDKAVSEALKMHFETQHKAIEDFGGVSEAMARNKEREEGGAPVVINNDASVRSNSSSYGIVNESITPRNGLLTTAVSTD